jgi:predicted DNA-binding transcriptional regulator YafY
LRRRALSVEPDSDGWEVVTVPLGDPVGLAEEVVSFGPAVEVLEPPEVREAVIRRLRRLVGTDLVPGGVS